MVSSTVRRRQIAAARVRLDLAKARARRLGLPLEQSADVAAKARRLADLEGSIDPPTEPRHRRDLDGPPEEN